MELLFLVIAFIFFLALNSFLENIAWIGAIILVLIVISIVRAFSDYKEFGFHGADFMMLLLKLSAIGVTIWLMCI